MKGVVLVAVDGDKLRVLVAVEDGAAVEEKVTGTLLGM